MPGNPPTDKAACAALSLEGVRKTRPIPHPRDLNCAPSRNYTDVVVSGVSHTIEAALRGRHFMTEKAGFEGELNPVVGRVVGTEDATPLSFWVALAPEQYLQLDDVVVCERAAAGRRRGRSALRRRHPGARPPRGRPLRLRRVPHRGRRAARARPVEAAEVLTTRVEPEIFVPPLPGRRGAARASGDERDQALVLRRDGARAADRSRPRRRAAVRQPRVPRRHPRRARQHLRHLRRRDQDDLRDVPALLPVQLGRARRRRDRTPRRSSST